MTVTYEQVWGTVGLVGQGVFTARFAVQWFASERKRETVVPVAFWWLSLLGGLITLTYAIHLRSLAFTLGQSLGLFVYVRNLMIAISSIPGFWSANAYHSGGISTLRAQVTEIIQKPRAVG